MSQFLSRLFLVRLVLLAAVFAVAGCASVVRTQISAFSADPADFVSGTIVVEALDPLEAKTLEFAHYRTRLEEHLAQQGYRVLAPGEPSDLVALLGYEVHETRGRERPRTGHMAHYRTGYFRPHHSVLVMDDGGRTEYQRRVSLVIAQGDDRERRLYEVTGVSQGTCPILSVVIDEMLEALFTDFPASNGAVRTVRVRGDTRC